MSIIKLYHIADPNCKDMIDIVPNVKLVYKMREEFKPYLEIEFVPNKDKKYEEQILLINIKEKKYKLIPKENINDKYVGDSIYILLKNFIKYKDCKDTNDSKFHRNKVIQGWDNIINYHKGFDFIHNFKLIPNKNYEKEYTYNNINIENKGNNKYEECSFHHPIRSHLYNVCVNDCNNLNYKDDILMENILSEYDSDNSFSKYNMVEHFGKKNIKYDKILYVISIVILFVFMVMKFRN